jgi:hypothetical protein
MTLSEIKNHLKNLETIAFELPNGSLVPTHFHVTEIGKVSKHFIDCGGTVRKENVVNFQLWEANDYDHRLHPEKLVHIIELSEKALGLDDLNIEVEYQDTTIGKFGLNFDGTNFLLTTKQTDCLAKSYCEIPNNKQNKEQSNLCVTTSCC